MLSQSSIVRRVRGATMLLVLCVLVFALFLIMACSGRRARQEARGERSAARPSAAPAQAPETGDASAASGSAAAMAAAAQKLLDVAGDSRERLALAFDDEEREDWNYVPRSRAGLARGDMSEAQSDATQALLRAGLSDSGHAKVTGILRIEPILGQLEGNPSFRDPGRYHMAIFGRPGAQARWGWRFEGHHLSLNFTHAAGRVATTPAFLGANPARVPSGPHRGLRVLAAEEDLGRALFASLTGEQRRRALLSSSAPSDIVTEASRRVELDGFVGLPAAEMTAEQRAALRRLVEVYVGDFQPDLARAHLQRIEAGGWTRLHFAWAGSAEPGRSHYYRIHGPTHVIEYDNRGGNHIHTVLRDVEQDFGDGLLARHLRDHHGGAGH
jgi:Protein of unknown function (DUF3500)